MTFPVTLDQSIELSYGSGGRSSKRANLQTGSSRSAN